MLAVADFDSIVLKACACSFSHESKIFLVEFAHLGSGGQDAVPNKSILYVNYISYAPH